MKSWQLWISKLLLAAQIGLLTYLFVSSTSDGRYFLAHEDEVINYCAARLFSETGSVRAEDCIDEDVSRVGQMNWYGPGYHLIYGTLQKVFGDHSTLFIQAHFVFALLTVLLMFVLPVTVEHKLLIANAVSFIPQFFQYVFEYFPETLHILFSTLLILLLLAVHLSDRPGKRTLYAGLFIGLVLVLTICRVTTIFWLAALVGLSNSRKEVWGASIVFVAGIALSLVYMKYFLAPPYAGELHKIDQLFEFDLVSFAWKTLKAFLKNSFHLLTSRSVPVYLLLVLLLIAAVRWWRTRERFLLASMLVSGTLIVALLSYYSASPWYFVKQSAVLVPFLLVSLITSQVTRRFKYGLIALSMVCYAYHYRGTTLTIEDHRNMHLNLRQHEPFRAALQELKDKITGTDPVTILYCYNEYDFGSVTQALLPFSTHARQPILYTTNIVSPADGPEIKFRLHGKLKVGYLLSRYPVDWPTLVLIHSTPYYFFYKFPEE